MNKRIFVDALNNEPTYANFIVTFLSSIIKGTAPSTGTAALDMLEEAFFSTGDIRFGPKPNVEHVYNIRQTIDYHMAKREPIPVLVPWGSIKAKFGANIDMAEVIAISQIVALNKRVKAYYEPGIEVRLRIEDTSGLELFKLEGKPEELIDGTFLYTNNLIRLINVLDDDRCILPVRESDMMNVGLFTETVERLIPVFEKYLEVTDDTIERMLDTDDNVFTYKDEYKALQALGWEGIISIVQRNHYYKAYEKLYNGDKALMRKRLAMYFAGSLARHKLGMTGVTHRWMNKFIQISFVPPISGLPEGYNRNYIYYRTMPEAYARTHMPPWRAKGYLRIIDNGQGTKACPKLATWHESKPYNNLTVTIANGDKTVDVSVDFVLETK